MGKIAKNYLYNASYQLLVIIAPIITAPYLARVLGAEKLGIYSYVSSSGNIISTISLLGIYAYGNRLTAYVRESRENLTKTFWELEITHILLGVVGTVIYFYYVAFNSEYKIYFEFYYPYILAQFLDCSWVYVGLEDMKPTVIKNCITKLINIVGIFVLVRTENDLWIYIAMLALTTLIADISIYTQLPRHIGKPCLNLKAIPQHLKGSIGLFLPQMASLFYLQVDKVMLAWLTGTTEQVSFYDQAEKIITIPLSLITVISSVMMPRIANEYQKNHTDIIRSLLLKAGKFALCLSMPMMLGVFCVARQFIPWYLGNEFYPTAIAIMILSPIILLNTLTGISGKQYFTATNQMQILLKSYGVAATMNVIINSVLIPSFGYIGAAVATVISGISSTLIQYRYLQKQMNLIVLRHYIQHYFIGALLMAIIISFLSWNMVPSVMTAAIQVIVGVLVYTLYLLITRDTIIMQILATIKKL